MILNRNRLVNIVILLLSFVLLLVIVFARAPYRQEGALLVSDGFGYYIYLPSIIIDRDLDLSNQLSTQPGQSEHWAYQNFEGRQFPGNIFQIGPAMLWLPFFLLTHLLYVTINLFGGNIVLDGFGFQYELPVYIGSFTYGLLGLYFAFRLVCNLWGRRPAIISTLFLTLSSPIAAYLWFEPVMAHILSFFLISLLFYKLYRIYEKQTRDMKAWFIIGLIIGLIAAIRIPDSIVALTVPLCALWTYKIIPEYRNFQNWKSFIITMMIAGIAALLAFSPQLIIWKILYGNYITMPPNPFYTGLNLFCPDIINYLISTKHGLFAWTPILFIATLGLILSIKKNQVTVIVLAILCLAIYFNSSIYQWWVGSSFGARRMVDYSIIFIIGLGYLIYKIPNNPKLNYWIFSFGLILVIFNWLLMLRYFTNDLPEHGEVSYYNLYCKTFQILANIFDKRLNSLF